ncbi:MAG: APC family permease [Pseudomonadota bacterium]
MTNTRSKILGQKDLVLFTVSAVVLLDTLAASASIGVSSLFWWPFLGVIFLVPIGLITAELSTAYPSGGGIYVWVRQAFGYRWAARVAWAYWINVAIWLPAIFVLAIGILSQIVGVEIAIGLQIIVGIACGWLVVGLEFFGLNVSKWVPNFGAALKFFVFGVLIVMGLRHGLAHGLANELSLQSISPSWQDGIQYLPVIIFGMLGFELVSSAGDEIKSPRQTIPVAVLLSGLVTLFLYVFATFGILAAIPVGQIDIVEGLIDTFRFLLAEMPASQWIILGLGLATLFSLFANGAAWAIGANRLAAEAASEGQLPSIFAIRSQRHGGPIGAALVLGCICTGILFLYGSIATSNEELFWTLLSFSGVIFMMPYIAMVFAFLKLRTAEPGVTRPFTAPGGSVGAHAMAAVCVIILLLTIVLFLYVPGDGVQWATLGGVIAVLTVGEWLIQLGMSQHRKGAMI